MKLALIGGGGVRTPLLVNGLTHADLPIDEIALFDEDRDRLGTIGGLAGLMAGNARLRLCDTSAECISGADFVFTSIRVGGIARRARDEATALRHGIVGQETIGPTGFAMALRTIPAMVAYAEEVRRLAPRAWIVNFTNPVGMITEAVRTVTDRVIGICDTPMELYEEVAHALDLPSAECRFDYFGLNHLGWIREVFHRGEPQLHRLWTDPARLRQVYRAPLFDPAFLSELRLLPTEYVYYYYRAKDAYDHLRRAGSSRGRVIEELNDQLFRELATPDADAAAVYERYLATRNAGYMQLESGGRPSAAVSPWAALTGYDKIALAVVRAVYFNANALIPLSVANSGNIPALEVADVVEVPCVVNGNGAQPVHVGAVPERVRPLLVQVKAYERLTVRAALSRSLDSAREALALNPLVRDRALLDPLLADLSPLW